MFVLIHPPLLNNSNLQILQMMLSSKKLKLKVALATSGCHRPQWRREKRLSLLSSTGTKLLSAINMSLKLRLVTVESSVADVCLSISYSQWFKSACF